MQGILSLLARMSLLDLPVDLFVSVVCQTNYLFLHAEFTGSLYLYIYIRD